MEPDSTLCTPKKCTQPVYVRIATACRRHGSFHDAESDCWVLLRVCDSVCMVMVLNYLTSKSRFPLVVELLNYNYTFPQACYCY